MSKTNNRIEKRMPAGGKNISPEGIEKVLLADLDKIRFDAELNIFSNIMDKFREDQRSGNIPKQFGIDDWMKSKSKEELFEIGRGNWRRGGRVGMGEGGDPDKTFKPSSKNFIDEFHKLMLMRSQLDPLHLKIIDELVEKSLEAGKKK